jgi:hypothetical protein
MKPMTKDDGHTDDDAQFDRLVDGELSPSEYESLVASLDDEPGGWRRCALAFLEAQALGRELGAIRLTGQLHEPAAAPAPAAIVARQPASAAYWKMFLAMSAVFLVAFILGATLPGLWPSRRSDGSTSRHVLAGPEQVQPGPLTPEGLMRTVGHARLVIDGPGGAQSQAGDVPIVEMPAGASDEWLTRHEPVLPVGLINELQRRGHRVERVQQYVPVSLEDGREGVIPVESYQITPVSRRAY